MEGPTAVASLRAASKSRKKARDPVHRFIQGNPGCDSFMIRKNNKLMRIYADRNAVPTMFRSGL